MFCVEWMSNQLNKSGGVPERLIGAVLKTVERASVPWVRIPPPPPFRKSLKRLFFSAFLEFQNFQKQLNLVPKGTVLGLVKYSIKIR